MDRRLADEKDYIGRVALCKRGRLGKVTMVIQSHRYGIEKFLGVKLDGSKWQSKRPVFLADEDQVAAQGLFEREGDDG